MNRRTGPPGSWSPLDNGYVNSGWASDSSLQNGNRIKVLSVIVWFDWGGRERMMRWVLLSKLSTHSFPVGCQCRSVVIVGRRAGSKPVPSWRPRPGPTSVGIGVALLLRNNSGKVSTVHIWPVFGVAKLSRASCLETYYTVNLGSLC